LLNQMLLRLFAVPLLLLLGALLALLFLGSFVPHQMNSTILAGLGQQAAELALPVFWGFVLAAVVTALYQGFQLWRWHQGKTDICDNCGGMVSMRNGRYGPYMHCLACGKNRSI